MFLKKKEKTINEEDRYEQELFQGRELLPSPEFNSKTLKINKQTNKKNVVKLSAFKAMENKCQNGYRLNKRS